MDQSTVATLLVGGLIGFLFSFLTSITAFVFQLYRDKQSNKWEIEKQRKEDEKRIVLSRLDTLEAQVFGIMDGITSISNTLNLTLSTMPDSKTLDDLVNIGERYIIPIVNEQVRLIANTFYFRDGDLRDSIVDLYKQITQLKKFYEDFMGAVEAKDVNAISSLSEGLINLRLDISDSFTRFNRRVDFVRFNVIEQVEKIKMDEEFELDFRKSLKNRDKK